MEPINRQFRLDKNTKNTHRYAEILEPGEEPVIGKLYVHKRVLDGLPPKEISVTVEEPEAEG